MSQASTDMRSSPQIVHPERRVNKLDSFVRLETRASFNSGLNKTLYIRPQDLGDDHNIPSVKDFDEILMQIFNKPTDDKFTLENEDEY